MPARDRSFVDSVIKAYDVRGVVGEHIDEAFVKEVGAAFARLLRSEGESTVAVGHDMRESSPSLSDAFAEGVMDQGLDVVKVHLCSTDELYYASGSMKCAGAMFTASHKPAWLRSRMTSCAVCRRMTATGVNRRTKMCCPATRSSSIASST